MSVKHRVKDRDSNGRIKRKYTSPWPTYFLNQTPSWWTKTYMTVPRRRENNRLCHDIVRRYDADNMVFPLGNCKPHIYYW